MKKTITILILILITLLLFIYIPYAYSTDKKSLILNIPGIISWIIMIIMLVEKISPMTKIKLRLCWFKIMNFGIKVDYSARFEFDKEIDDQIIKSIEDKLNDKYNLKKFATSDNFSYHIQFDTMDLSMIIDTDLKSLYFSYKFIELGYRDLKNKLEDFNNLFYILEENLKPNTKNYSSCIKFKKNPFILLIDTDKVKDIHLDLDSCYITKDCMYINSDNINDQYNSIIKNLLFR